MGADGGQYRCSAGFTLIEILVALAIFGLAFGLAFQVLSAAGYNSVAGRREEQAVTVAEDILARVGHDLPADDGESRGDVQRTYGWVLDISHVRAADRPQGQQFVLKQLTVSVLWQQFHLQHKIVLTTRRLVSGGELGAE